MECEPLALQGLPSDLPTKQRRCEPWPQGVRFRGWGSGTQDVPYCNETHHDINNPPWRARSAELRGLMCRLKSWLLFSERLKVAVEKAGLKGCQFYPVSVEVPWEASPLRYWYAHVVWLDGAIDLDHSRYEWVFVPGIVRPALCVFEYVLKRSVVRSVALFRVAASTACVFCSERFRELFVSQGYTGLGFLPVGVSE